MKETLASEIRTNGLGFTTKKVHHEVITLNSLENQIIKEGNTLIAYNILWNWVGVLISVIILIIRSFTSTIKHYRKTHRPGGFTS